MGRSSPFFTDPAGMDLVLEPSAGQPHGILTVATSTHLRGGDPIVGLSLRERTGPGGVLSVALTADEARQLAASLLECAERIS